MKVSVKTTSGEAYQITVPHNSAISDLKLTAVVASSSLNSSNLNVYNLYFKGVKLDLLKNVSNYGISDNDTIVIGSKVPQENVNVSEAAEGQISDVKSSSPAVASGVSDGADVAGAQPAEQHPDGAKPAAGHEQPSAASAVASAPGTSRSKSPVASAATHSIAKKKKSSKNSKKCNFANCNNASLRIIGNCQDCNGNFCSKHRLMENHMCSGLLNTKKVAFNRNANKLHQEQTISQKV